jgi:cytochrome c5
MNRITMIILAAALFSVALLSSGAQASETQASGAPKMPYVFEMYCYMCHKEHVQIGPVGIFDMRSKAGNPLHEQYVRNNVRFGYNAMPAFRLSEVSPKELDDIVNYLKDLAAYRKNHPAYQPTPVQQGGAKK